VADHVERAEDEVGTQVKNKDEEVKAAVADVLVGNVLLPALRLGDADHQHAGEREDTDSRFDQALWLLQVVSESVDV